MVDGENDKQARMHTSTHTLGTFNMIMVIKQPKIELRLIVMVYKGLGGVEMEKDVIFLWRKHAGTQSRPTHKLSVFTCTVFSQTSKHVNNH